MKLRKTMLLLLLGASWRCNAQDLTPESAAALLAPMMPPDCGSYYTTQGEPEFAALDGKSLCKYQPAVSRVDVDARRGTATVAYTRDRAFDPELSKAWLDAYAKMEPRKPDSLLFKKLKSNLESWLAHGGVDRGYKPSKAKLSLAPNGWHVDAIN